MSDGMHAHTLGEAIAKVRANWGWFVALGVGLLILGVIAVANLLNATVASVLLIAGIPSLAVRRAPSSPIRHAGRDDWSCRLVAVDGHRSWRRSDVVACANSLVSHPAARPGIDDERLLADWASRSRRAYIAMLSTTCLVAVAIYEYFGLAFLRRGWINLDLIWTLALLITGLILIAI